MTPFHLDHRLAITSGEQLLWSRDYDGAIIALQNAVGMAHGSESALSRAKRTLGEAYLKIGDIDRAQRKLDEALELALSSDLLSNAQGAAMRILAELAYDKAKRLHAGTEQDEMLELADTWLDKAEWTIRSNSSIKININELTIIQSLKGARSYERGDKKYGKDRLRRSAEWEITPETAYYVLVNSLRLMKYSPIDRLSSAWRILRVIKETKTTRPSPYTAYRTLAFRALIGLPVKL